MSKAMHAKPFRLTGPYTGRHARPESPRSKLIRAVSLGLACVCLLLTATVYPASAATSNTSMASLQSKLDKLSQSINQHKKELSDAKKKESAAKALESELKERVTVLQDQISVLGGQIAAVQNSIGEKEQQIGVMQTQITDKQTQIEQKQNEIDDQWDDFKKHMAAKQELEDDKAALEEQKAGLEAEKAELQSQKSELDSQNAQMKGKQSELNNSISAAKLSAAEAQAAQQKAQAAIESDELNYEAVKKEIQKMIAAASASKPQLSFSGFACPLKSYSRISSEYGWRKNPVSGVNKLHAGIDFAAAGGTPIYAAASGYVQVAGWSTGGYGNYVIIYHGKMSDGNTYTTLYAHMRSVATSAGKYVKQGELIGYVGTTGNSTGNHLHLEVWKGGSKANAVNPRSCIPIPHN